MSERLILKGLKPFSGHHCETTALKRVLDYHELSLSEDMLFGLGGGIGFLYWYMKTLPAPFVGSRYGKVAEFLGNTCRRIGADMSIMETSSPKKGYEELKALLRSGEPAVAYGDMAYFPYLAHPEVAHFGGHAVAVFGLDEERGEVHLYDRGRNPVVMRTSELARARSSSFAPFAPKHRLLHLSYPSEIASLEPGIKQSITECCRNMLQPAIRNIGLAGMEKWSRVVVKWPEQFSGTTLLNALINGFTYIEIAGTGGSGFRTMYARFLDEASQVVGEPALREVAGMMRQAAVVWSDIATGFLPDSQPNLKTIRELLVEKNRLSEEQEPGSLEAMLAINRRIEELARSAIADLTKYPDFLTDVQRNIIKCYQIESKVFEKLATIIQQW